MLATWLAHTFHGQAYSCLVLPKRVVFSFWEVTGNR
jgi:hypothetical protein